MSRKAFFVQVELDVQAVTCPGVWLCSNGKVSLQIYMLDSCVQTGCYKPIFPVHCNEKFVFYKTFYSKHQLDELQKDLHDQWLYIEMVQWQNCELGNVLASFQTSLDEFLFPSAVSGSIAGVDLDLLMEPSKTFPGTIAPKIEVSTKTTIEEILCSCVKPSSSNVIINPKVLTSTQEKCRRNVCRKVCHSIGFSRQRQRFKPCKTRPPFRYRRAEDDLILRKPQYDLDGKYCTCRESRSLERKPLVPCREKTGTLCKPGRLSCQAPARMCSCGSGHKENFCPVCSKYKGYFNVVPATLSPRAKKKETPRTSQTRTTLFNEPTCYKPPKSDQYCSCCRPMAFTTTDSNASDTEQDKIICFCADEKPSLAEKLHAKLTKTLNSIPRSIEWSCCDYDYECDCCDCPENSKADIYRDLQKFYGDLYDKVRASTACVPDCPRLKST